MERKKGQQTELPHHEFSFTLELNCDFEIPRLRLLHFNHLVCFWAPGSSHGFLPIFSFQLSSDRVLEASTSQPFLAEEGLQYLSKCVSISSFWNEMMNNYPQRAASLIPSSLRVCCFVLASYLLVKFSPLCLIMFRLVWCRSAVFWTSLKYNVRRISSCMLS